MLAEKPQLIRIEKSGHTCLCKVEAGPVSLRRVSVRPISLGAPRQGYEMS